MCVWGGGRCSYAYTVATNWKRLTNEIKSLSIRLNPFCQTAHLLRAIGSQDSVSFKKMKPSRYRILIIDIGLKRIPGERRPSRIPVLVALPRRDSNLHSRGTVVSQIHVRIGEFKSDRSTYMVHTYKEHYKKTSYSKERMSRTL